MELTVRLSGLRHHKDLLREEWAAAERLERKLKEDAALAAANGMAQDSMETALRNVSAVKKSIRRRMEFLDELKDAVERENDRDAELVAQAAALQEKFR